jgi:hypothetical protein
LVYFTFIVNALSKLAFKCQLSCLQEEVPIEDLKPEGVDAYVVDFLSADANDAFEVKASRIRAVTVSRGGKGALLREDAVVGTSYQTW